MPLFAPGPEVQLRARKRSNGRPRKKGAACAAPCSEQSCCLVANCLWSAKCVQERVPAVHRGGRTDTSEPREEHQVFRMVGEREATAHSDREVAARNRVAHFKVVLAPADLTNVAPRRNNVRARNERIVHPFAYFMAEGVNVTNTRPAEDSSVAVRRNCVGLRSGVIRAVIAENAALTTRGPERVVRQEQR